MLLSLTGELRELSCTRPIYTNLITVTVCRERRCVMSIHDFYSPDKWSLAGPSLTELLQLDSDLVKFISNFNVSPFAVLLLLLFCFCYYRMVIGE